jgi:hypothetical protein
LFSISVDETLLNPLFSISGDEVLILIAETRQISIILLGFRFLENFDFFLSDEIQVES